MRCARICINCLLFRVETTSGVRILARVMVWKVHWRRIPMTATCWLGGSNSCCHMWRELWQFDQSSSSSRTEHSLRSLSCVLCRVPLSFVVCLLSLILHKNWWWWRQSLAIKNADILSAAYRWTFNKPLGRWMSSSLSISHADYIKDTQAHTNTHYNLISDLNLPLSFASCRWRGCTLSSRPFWRCTIMW